MQLRYAIASHGYRTESLGKVFHIGHGNQGDLASFMVPYFHDKVIEYLDPEIDGGKSLRKPILRTKIRADPLVAPGRHHGRRRF